MVRLEAAPGGRSSHEIVLSAVATRLLAAESSALPEVFEEMLATLGEQLDADRAYAFAYDREGDQLALAADWCRAGVAPVDGELFDIAPAAARWWTRSVLSDEPIAVRGLDEVGSATDPDGLAARALLEEQQVSGMLVVPVVVHERPLCCIGLSVVDRPYPFGDDVPHLLRITGQLVVDRVERARAEAALDEVRLELERRNTELVRSNRRLEEFAYVASHDLKSPLLVVRGFLDLLEREKGGPLTEEGRSFVAAALRGASRMERLIDDLLAYSRVGRRPAELEDVDLAELVGWVLDDSAVLLGAAGATVDVDVLPLVRGERTGLAQVLQNLIDNGVKFARPGVPAHLTIRAARGDDEWVVSVSDNGVGIPPEDRDRVFGMFARLDATVDRAGSGIGLAIAQRVVEAHRGRIWVSDTPGGGTTFSFSLPA